MSRITHTDRFQRLQVAILKIHNKTFPVYDGVNTVGRNKEAIVNIKHLNVSQNHAVIVIINGNHFVSDLNSSNGTFLEDRKVDPFTLSELKNNTSIKLGDLHGTYISQGPFSSDSQCHFEMTQEVTQSFYGSSTQIMDNLKMNFTDNEIEDIHEAPTQEISWTAFKIPKNVKSAHVHENTTKNTNNTKLPGNTEALEVIHNCATSVVCHTFESDKSQSNNLQASDDKKLENMATKQDKISHGKENKNLPTESMASSKDIHDASIPILPVFSSNSNSDIPEPEFFSSYNAEELPLLADNDNYIEIHQIPEVDKTTDIHEAVTQVIDMSKTIKSPVPNSNVDDDEATDCEDNVDAANNIKDSAEGSIPEPEFFGSYNDEELPLLADNDNYIEIHQIPEVDKTTDIHEAVTQVIDISKTIKSPVPNSNVEDDEATDCEDNVDAAINIKDNAEGYKAKNGPDISQDETNDYDTQDNHIKTCLEQENKNNSSDVSNDSVDFFKLDRSINNDLKESLNKSNVAVSEVSFKDGKENEDGSISKIGQSYTTSNGSTETSSDETITFQKKKVCHLSSESETDDEVIGIKRKKKSLMVISTQDICERKSDEKLNIKNTDDNKKLSSRYSYIINDTDSETEVDPVNKVVLEESIAATQDKLTSDLNDTDCIPATQEVTKHFPVQPMTKSSQNFSDHANGSSEESFKLGLTELMTNSSQGTTNNPRFQDPCCSKSLRNQSPIFSAPSSKSNENLDNIQSEDTDKTDIYEAPTQVFTIPTLDGGDNNKTLIDDQSTIDIYIAPTQKISISETKDGKKLSDSLHENDHLNDVSIQKLNIKETKHYLGNNTRFDTTDADIYLAPTQKVSYEVTENLYDAPTQKFDVKKNKYPATEESELDATNYDTYFAPTQKFPNKGTDQNNSKQESMDELYLQPTQQLDNVFDQPTQKVNKSNFKIEGDEGENEFMIPIVEPSENVRTQGKNKFSFKKKSSYLDGSLTNLLDHNPEQATNAAQTTLQRVDRSSIELEIVQSVNDFAERFNRPSNPLSNILENSCKLDETKEKATDKIPVFLVSEDSKNQKETKDTLNYVCATNINVKCKNKRKLDSENNTSITLDNKPNTDGRTSAVSVSASSYDQITENSRARNTRSLRTRRSSVPSSANKESSGRTIQDLSKLEPQADKTEKKGNTKNELKTKPLGRETTRRVASLSDTKTINFHSDVDDNKLQVNTDLTDHSLNSTNSEVNQTLAFLESKITKTRKRGSSAKIQVKVPKSRKSMSISEIDDTSESSDNNISRRKTDKESRTDYEIKALGASATSTSTTKKRGRPKTRQPEDREIQDIKMTNKPLKEKLDPVTVSNDRPKRNYPNLEIVKEQEKNNLISKNIDDTNGKSSTSKLAEPAANKTRQVGKRKKQVADVKSDTSDTSTPSVDIILTPPKRPNFQSPRQAGKRKQISTEKSDNSDSSMQSVASTPKKQRLQPSEALLNTRERELRKQKPKVVFTMLESPQMESMIKRLGGSVIDSVEACTVLLTEHVKRSQKLLSAVGLGKPICSPKWITDSKKAHEFLDPWDYILTDPEAEKKWDFSLKESLRRSRTHDLLNSYSFQIMVTNASDVLKGAIESCGGKCISKIPSHPLENTYIISIPENQNKYRKVIKQHSNVKVIEPEAIFDGVLRQELRFSKHYLT